MFSKITGIIMSIIMFFCSLFGISFGEKDAASAEMLELNADKTVLSVNISENATTGYRWNCTVKDGGVIEKIADKYVYTAPSDMVGAPGTRTFSFRAVEDGKTEIILDYARSWEDAPIRTVVIGIEVLDGCIVSASVVSDNG